MVPPPKHQSTLPSKCKNDSPPLRGRIKVLQLYFRNELLGISHPGIDSCPRPRKVVTVFPSMSGMKSYKKLSPLFLEDDTATEKSHPEANICFNFMARFLLSSAYLGGAFMHLELWNEENCAASQQNYVSQLVGVAKVLSFLVLPSCLDGSGSTIPEESVELWYEVIYIYRSSQRAGEPEQVGVEWFLLFASFNHIRRGRENVNYGA